jgi:HEAT repeat protein
LLQLEGDPARWRDVAETVITHVEDLARLGLVEQACQLADAVAKETADSARRPHATRALERLGDGSLIKHAAGQLRGVDDLPANRVKRVCHAIGPSIIPALAEVLSTEQDARARARLREILVGYGPSGREAIQALLAAPNWQVRRTAAFLLHEFGGTESLDSLESLLCDLEPLVQREAIQGFILDGSESAFSLLRTVLTTCAPRVRASLVRELATMHDERAAPLFCHLVKNLNRRRLRSAYEVSIDALGTCGGPDAREALAFALRQGEWWAPFRTRALKTRAATALRRIGTPDAIQALREAANDGPRSTRRAARVALTGMEGK